MYHGHLGQVGLGQQVVELAVLQRDHVELRQVEVELVVLQRDQVELQQVEVELAALQENQALLAGSTKFHCPPCQV